MSSDKETELKATGPSGRVVPVHSTSVDSSSAWDRTAQFKKMRSPATPNYYNDIFAFQLPNTKGTRKTHYTFIHHFVGSNGAAGAASGRALGNSVAVLNGGRQGTVLRGAARQGVYRHIAAHYRDADREAPELKSDEDVDAIMIFKGLIDAPLAESLDLTVKGLQDLDNIIDVESDVSWFEGEQEIKGIVVEADDDVALVEEVNEKGERTGEFYELDYVEMKLRTFVVMEKAGEMMEKGAVVSWDTSNGKYYGDIMEVVTDGMARGEPQGLEIEGSEENPAYVIRVWMMEEREAEEDEPAEDDDEKAAKQPKNAKSAGEWTPTNVTVVARGDGLTVEDTLPTETPEEGYSEGEDEEESSMKMMDGEFMALVEQAIKQNATILERLAQYDTADEGAVEEVGPATEEVKSEETTTEIVKEKTAEETPVAETTEVVEEVKSEDAPVETTEVAETTTEIAEEKTAEEETVEEKTAEETVVETATISFDDLKEFHLLLKDISK